MLIIKPIQDKALQEKFCALCNIPYRADTLAYFAADGDDETHEPVRLLGICQFSAGGTLNDLAPVPGVDDEEALQIMAKASMSFIYRCGCKLLRLVPDACPEALALKLGFRKNDDGTLTADLEKMYGSCHCH